MESETGAPAGAVQSVFQTPTGASLPEVSIGRFTSALADESRAAGRIANVLLGIAAIGAATPLAILILNPVENLRDILRCAAIAFAAGFLDLILLKFYRSSQRQRRKLLSRCADVEQRYFLAQLALRSGEHQLAAELIQSVPGPQRKSGNIGKPVARGASQCSQPSADILHIEQALERRRSALPAKRRDSE